MGEAYGVCGEMKNADEILVRIPDAWKVLKFGAGEGWRRSVGPIM